MGQNQSAPSLSTTCGADSEGLEQIPDGIDQLRKGVSAKKLVVRV